MAGSSLGAWIALELARLGRARSVTSLCAAGFWSRPLLADDELPRKPGPVLARALLPIMGPLLRTRRGRRVVLGMNMAHPERVTHAEALDIVRAYATAPGYPATNLAMRRTSFQGAEGIDVPVTLAWGEHDRLVRPPAVASGGLADGAAARLRPPADVGRPRARRARDPRDRDADVIATPARAIAPPTAVSGEGTSPSATQPTSAATGGTA